MLYHLFQTLVNGISLMTRQECVIRIAKINKVFGELKYRIDIEEVPNFASFVPILLMTREWAVDIRLYVNQEPSPTLVRQIANIGYHAELEKYLIKHKADLPVTFTTALDESIKNVQSLLELCQRYQHEERGQYEDLIKPLANEQASALLQRAVDAGLLDVHFQPSSNVTPIQLRVIAFAISAMCKLPHTYAPFEKQWENHITYRISTCNIPKRNVASLNYAMELYPEVDFKSFFEPAHNISPFYVPQDRDDIIKLYKSLLKYGYISSETTLKTFEGIFDKTKFVKPVVWIKEQRQLAYFIYLAFGKFNKKNLWKKGEKFFRVNGQIPHVASLSSGYGLIKRAGWMDRFDIQLKAICESFHHMESGDQFLKGNAVRPIRISKNVFYSNKNKKAKQAVFSALRSGGYISPDTTSAIFMGLFDETKFTRPIIWIKSQTSLMYFVYLAFRSENPFDFWTKCVNCFQIHEDKPINLESLRSNFRSIKNGGKLDTYDIELKRIADEYNGYTTKKEATASDNMPTAYIT